jgi:hypothetical protein
MSAAIWVCMTRTIKKSSNGVARQAARIQTNQQVLNSVARGAIVAEIESIFEEFTEQAPIGDLVALKFILGTRSNNQASHGAKSMVDLLSGLFTIPAAA